MNIDPQLSLVDWVNQTLFRVGTVTFFNKMRVTVRRLFERIVVITVGHLENGERRPGRVMT